MPDFRDRIDVFCVGDDLDVRRTVRKIPAGQTVVEAWLTIKEDEEDSDAEAVLQKHITGTDVPGTGAIEADGSTDQIAVLRFDLTAADTLLLEADAPYFHDVQIKTSAGKLNTPFKGMTIAKQQITVSN